MQKIYVFTINPEIDLLEQNISPEANAIIVNLFRDYFATREKYNPDDIFKKVNKDQHINVETPIKIN